VRRGDLLQQLGALVTDLTPVLAPVAALEQASALCGTARLAFGAAAVSLAATRDDALHYLAADGEGADAIVGTELALGRGIAGYVALTGQALAIDRATDDPRFARDVAERTGYVPTSMLVVPVRDRRGDTVGVISVLDRTLASADALVLASSFAGQAALLLPVIDDTGRAARLVLDAVVAAVREHDTELGSALRRSLARLPEADAELAHVAATLCDLRSADAATRARVAALLDEIVALATARRRR